jgi:hypothetical protein
MKGNHGMQVPNLIWEWGQRESGKKNPSSWLRERLYMSMIHGLPIPIEVVNPAPAEPTLEEQWAALGCGTDFVDDEWNLARAAFIEANGGELAALAWIRESIDRRGMRNPRGFIVSWYKGRI